tara:strand:- start:68 stop:265 length:198 start_codon:yes stop_codon:yes gene_type:complete
MEANSFLAGLSLSSILYLHILCGMKDDIIRLEKQILLKNKELDMLIVEHNKKRKKKTLEVFDISG